VRVIAATHQDLEQRVKEGVFREDLFHRLNVIRLRLPPLRERRDDIAGLTRHFLQQSAKQLGVEPKRISAPALEMLARFAFPGNVRQLENICHWLTVMAPAQTVETKDLPPDVIGAATVPSAMVAVEHPLRHAAPHADSAKPVAPRPLHEPDPAVAAAGMPDPAVSTAAPQWELLLQSEASQMLAGGQADVWEALTRRFESMLIQTALEITRGRRIEAAHKLGIGRNTITRKIQDLGLE
jgi:two-component system nitrogen regulation response regulator GlnG